MFRVFLTTALLLAIAFSPATAQQPARPTQLQVLLPPDASLQIDAYRTTSMGSVRTYISPPLPFGVNYKYTLEATWQGKVLVREVQVTGGQTYLVELRAEDFQTAPATPTGNGARTYAREGFVTELSDGRLWVFRAGSKELAEFKKSGAPEVHVSRVNAPPFRITVKAPNTATLEEYLAAKPGFITKYDAGRMWIFRKGSKEWAAFQKDGDLEQHVVRIGGTSSGLTLRAPDRETLDAYLKADAP